jgi:hypothetical protein
VVAGRPVGRPVGWDGALRLLPAGWALPGQEALAGLSRFAVAGRYPEGPFDAGPDPTWSDAEEAVRLAESVATGILAGARSRGIGRPE